MHNRPSFFGHERRGYHHGSLKEALVEAARTLIAERGPAGFTLADAAKLAGVTAAAPYRHFSDRSALMGELARRGFEAFGERLSRAWDGGHPDAVTAARRMGEAYLGFAREEPGLYSAMFGNAQTLNAPEPGAAATRALESLRAAAAAMLTQHGAPHGDARQLAFEIWSVSHGVAMLVLSGHLTPAGGCAPDDILQSACASLVEGAVRRTLAGPSPAEPVVAGPWSRQPANNS